jgi:hypothetical protein
MIPYILHVTVIITVCFLFYKVFLQKETFYRLNRWTLMTCLAVAFALPLLPAPRQWSWRAAVPLQQALTVASQPPTSVPGQQVPVQPSFSLRSAASRASFYKHPASHRKTRSFASTPITLSSADLSSRKADTIRVSASPSATLRPAGSSSASAPFFPLFIHWLFYFYWFGVIIFGANFLLQIVILLYQSYKSPVIRDGRYRIVETSGNRAPCSFGNNIFINPSLYDWETYNQILIHEKIHVSGRHTIDILLAEIVVILQWFNPFAWLYRKEVENNLEFLTDHSVLLHQEVERSAYQLSLLRVSAPHLPFSITTNYNQSLLKRRIVMMNSKHSSQHTVWKYFFLIPVLTILVCALNKPVAFGQSSTSDNKDRSGRHNDPSGAHKIPSGGSGDTSIQRNDSSAVSTIRLSLSNQAPLTHIEGAGARSLSVSLSGQDPEPYVVQSLVTANNSYSYNPDSRSYARRAYVNTRGSGDSRGEGDSYGEGAVSTNVSIGTRVDALTNLYAVTAVGAMGVNEGEDETEGSWFVTSSDDKMNFELKGETEDHSWSNSFTVVKSEINPFPGQGTVEFKLVREAGTIVFKGQFDGQEGFGHYKFKADESYINYLKQQGVEDLEERRIFSYFTANVTKDFANMILHNGYPHISGRYLISMARMHIDEAYLKSWKQAGFGELSEQDLVSAKSMHVDPAYAQEMKAAGYDNLTFRELIRLKNQHVDGDYVRSLHTASGSTLPPPQDLIAYKSMRIDSGYLASLQKIGYTGLTYRDVISLHNMHVTADYIKSFQALGYKDISARSLISLKSRDITPDFIKGFKDLGYDDVDLRELSTLKAVGVTPEFVKGFKSIGFDHIPVRELSSLKEMGVDAAYISKMKEKGFISNDLNKYIRLKRAFE